AGLAADAFAFCGPAVLPVRNRQASRPIEAAAQGIFRKRVEELDQQGDTHANTSSQGPGRRSIRFSPGSAASSQRPGGADTAGLPRWAGTGPTCTVYPCRPQGQPACLLQLHPHPSSLPAASTFATLPPILPLPSAGQFPALVHLAQAEFLAQGAWRNRCRCPRLTVAVASGNIQSRSGTNEKRRIDHDPAITA